MPIKSQAQRRKFAELLVDGKISNEIYERWNRRAGYKELPERVKPKAKSKSKRMTAAKAKPKKRTTSRSASKTKKRSTSTRRLRAKVPAAIYPARDEGGRRDRRPAVP